MHKVKPQLIIYRPSRSLNNVEDCIKKRLYISNFQFFQDKRSLSNMRKITQAKIYKYINKIYCDFLDVFSLKESLKRFVFHVLLLHITKVHISSHLGLQLLPRYDKTLVKKLVRQQKRLQKFKLHHLGSGVLHSIILKALFQTRSLKSFELIKFDSHAEDLAAIKAYLQRVHKRRPWTAMEWQKINLGLSNPINDGDLNKHLDQYSKKLFSLKHLIKQTKTYITLDFNFGRMVNVMPKTWALLAKAMKDIENVTGLKYCGGPNRGFGIFLKGIKDLKKLEAVDLEFENNKFEEKIVPDSFASNGQSLTHFSLKIDCFEDTISYIETKLIPKLSALTKLKYLCLEVKVRGVLDNFFLQLSESLKLMTDLRGLKIIIHIPDSEVPTSFTMDKVKHLLTTIEGLVKLESLCFWLHSQSEEKIEMGVRPIYESILNLKQLKTLDCNLGVLKMGNKEITKFLRRLPELKQLEELSLGFCCGEVLEDKTQMLILKTIAQLKWLQKVDFEFGCSQIKEEFVNALPKCLMKLRYLKEVEVKIVRTVENVSLERELYKLRNSLGLGKKIDVYICIEFEE